MIPYRLCIDIAEIPGRLKNASSPLNFPKLFFFFAVFVFKHIELLYNI